MDDGLVAMLKAFSSDATFQSRVCFNSPRNAAQRDLCPGPAQPEDVACFHVYGLIQGGTQGVK